MSALEIVRRAEWGAAAPTGSMYTVGIKARTHVVVHYLGAEDAKPDQQAQLRWIQSFHQDSKNWSDIGYNYAIGLSDGTVYEARGRDKVGAHLPGYNRTGIGVVFLMGDDDVLTDAAKTSFLALKARLDRSAGKTLITIGHRDGKATACPGESVYAWVTAGTPAPEETFVPKSDKSESVVHVTGCPCPLTLVEGLAQGDIVSHPGTRPPVLRRGSRGPWVRELQRLLKIGQDGDFGPNTERWVRLYQGEANKYDPSVTVDGVVGPQTWKILYEFRSRQP